VHEFGHFIVAKKAGIRVDEFGIGFPPKLFGKKYGETEYTINALPIGGFVRIWGENPTEEHYDDEPLTERSFVKKPRYIQALVLVAGVTMNIFLAFVLYVGAYMIGVPTAIDDMSNIGGVQDVRLLVSSVLPNTPASEKLQSSDEIISLTSGEKTLSSEQTLQADEVAGFISASTEPVIFTLERHGETLQQEILPETGVFPDNPEQKAAGFSMALVGVEQFPLHMAIVEAGKRTYTSLIEVFVGLMSFFGGVITGSSDFSQITGPVGIVGLVGDAAALGFTWLLTFTAFISLNLAVINLLPFPALDGGRLVFVGIEAIIQKPIKPIVATTLNQIGFIALLLLMAVITFQDIARLI
jgi:regulator of sigma E protease